MSLEEHCGGTCESNQGHLQAEKEADSKGPARLKIENLQVRGHFSSKSCILREPCSRGSYFRNKAKSETE